MKKASIVLTAVLLVRSAQFAGAADAINEAFQKGLLEEEANHNLDAAIQAYHSVIHQFDDQRRIAATAVFRLAECYRKQGKTNEAVAQYQRVIQDFADQSDLIGLSERNLAALGRATNPGGADARGIAVQTVTDPEQLELLKTEIRLAEQQIETEDARFRNGKGGFADIVRSRKELLSLQRRLPENGGVVAQRNLVEQQVRLVEQLLREVKKQIEAGARALGDEIPLQRELVGLQRELVAISKGPSTVRSTADGESAAVSDEEAKKIQQLKEISKNSPDLIDAKDAGGNTPLHNEANQGHVVVARFLLENKADVNARDISERTPLHLAALHGYKAMAELLLSKGAAVNAKDGGGGTPLHTAAANGFVSLAKTLLEKGGDVNAKDNNNETPLHRAVEKGFKDMVVLLLAHQADPSISSSPPAQVGRDGPFPPCGTPLHLAVSRGRSVDEELVELLLESGAQVDAKDPFGVTPLQQAVLSNHRRMVEVLVSNDADVNGKDNHGNAPLHWAIGNKGIVEALLSHNADVNAQNQQGDTPLHAAVRNADKTTVELLLARGADVNARNSEGKTPLQLTKSQPAPFPTALVIADPGGPGASQEVTPEEIAELLRKHGAKE